MVGKEKMLATKLIKVTKPFAILLQVTFACQSSYYLMIHLLINSLPNDKS